MILDAPPGWLTVEVWGIVEGLDERMVLSFSQIDVVAGAWTVVDLQVGIAGATFPDACLDDCDGG
jgi:hypothetical protein